MNNITQANNSEALTMRGSVLLILQNINIMKFRTQV